MCPRPTAPIAAEAPFPVPDQGTGRDLGPPENSAADRNGYAWPRLSTLNPAWFTVGLPADRRTRGFYVWLRPDFGPYSA